MIIQPSIFDSSKIIAAQSTRLGGVSSEPFASLNLGLSVNDDEQLVRKNRELFFGGLGIRQDQLAISHQVHGNKILVVTEAGRTEGYDAQITNKQNIFLVVSIADCTPILIHDTKNNAVAAIHAGWKGTAGKIVAKTLQLMEGTYGTKGVDCNAFIGACISYRNFEVGEEVAEHFAPSLKHFNEEKQKWYVDLKKANQAQLTHFGVPENRIEINELCTIASSNVLFSHRAGKGKTGRMMAVIGIKA